jgi:hypothetical protein
MAIEERQVSVIPRDSFMERYYLEMYRFQKGIERKCPEGLQKMMSHLLPLATKKVRDEEIES